MSFISIPGATFELGWRYSLPAEAITSIENFVSWSEFSEHRLSKPRVVTLPSFEISETCLKLDSLIDLNPRVFESAEKLEDYCIAVDQVLAQWGTRLPTEDELEAAMGCHLFPWGDELPNGIP